VGIYDPHFTNSKADAKKLTDFEACQQLFKTLTYNKSIQENTKGKISVVTVTRNNANNIRMVDQIINRHGCEMEMGTTTLQ
jgi:hypothetical protein